jgi:hypothetical protein
MTTMAPAAAPVSADVPTLPIYRLSVEQYHAMIRHGILTPEDRVELIHGWLVPKMGQNPPHRVCVGKARRALDRLLPADWYADAQMPVTFTHSEPEPDVSVARAEFAEDDTRNPGPADVALVVEVSDTTLAKDRGTKKAMYAEVKIPVYWIVNLVDNQVEVHTDPSGPATLPDYATRQVLHPGDEVPVVIDGQEVGRIPVSSLLP